MVSLLERGLKYLAVRHFFRKAPPPVPAVSMSPLISILQPILSGDPTLADCLAHNLTRHSRYRREFIWLLDEADADAQALCANLQARFPGQTIRIVRLPPPPEGVNPKTFKLIAGLKVATGDFIAVLDDDTCLPDDAFAPCLPALNEPKVGLAFGLPYYTHFENLWSTLVAAFVNSQSLLTYVPYLYLSRPFTINGMFYVLKRAVLAELGGFSGLEKQLCDDYAVAQRVRAGGYRLAQTRLRHGIRTHVPTTRAYFNLLTRWFVFPQASIMKTAQPGELAIFYLTVLVPLFLPPILFLRAIVNRRDWVWPAAYLWLNAGLTIDLNRRYLFDATPLRKWVWLAAMPLLLPLHIAWALLAPRRIVWRGHLLQLLPDGSFRFVRRRSD